VERHVQSGGSSRVPERDAAVTMAAFAFNRWSKQRSPGTVFGKKVVHKQLMLPILGTSPVTRIQVSMADLTDRQTDRLTDLTDQVSDGLK
jgi:hypothetical protein